MRLSRTMRQVPGGALTHILLPMIILALAYVYLTRNGYIGGVNHFDRESASHKGGNGGPGAGAGPLPSDTEAKHPSEKDLEENLERIRFLPDFRPQACADKKYDISTRVSIIIDFMDFQLDEVKLTVGSVIINTPASLVEEIILVDDGSTMASIITESQRYAASVEKVRLIRTGVKVGASKARIRGAEDAKAPVLVFLETTAIVNKGWLEPLVDLLSRDPNAVAVPHFDKVKDPYQLDIVKTSDHLITTFTWSLTMRVSHSPEKRYDVNPIDSPVTRGNVFAMRKKFFRAVGGFDTELTDLTYEVLEFSFRVWLCGGSIRVLPCSRVNIFNLDDPFRLISKISIQRIADLWFGEHRHFVYNIMGLKASAISNSMEMRRADISSHLKCRDFSWYLKTVATHIVTPSNNAKYYGMLQCRSGRCARVGEDLRVVLGRCNPEDYELHPSAMFFELDDKKHLHVGGKCVTVQPNAHIKLEPCEDRNEQQVWEYDPSTNYQLRSPWAKYCAMHVTDPDDPNEIRQIMMVQQCSPGVPGGFNTWDFLEV